MLEIFTRHNPGDKLGVTSTLTPTELDQLVAYLEQLDDVEPTPTKPPVVTPQAAAGCGCATAGPAPDSSPLPLVVIVLSTIALRRARRRSR